MKRMMTLLVMVLGIVLAVDRVADACGRIIIDRPPRPDTRVINMSVQEAKLDIRIEEQIAVVTVDEIFHNSNPWRTEGTFILPILPETTIQNLSLWINGEETKGELLDKDKALQYYTETVRKMVDPALLEYAGYGLLKLRVFPIPAANEDMKQGPGNVRIKYAYSYRLSNDNGVCSFRHPWGTNKFSENPLQQAVINASVKSKIPIKTVYSPTYQNIDVIRKSDNEFTISFEQKNMKPDKDFILYYTLSEKQFGVNLVSYKKSSSDGFFMMMISPKYDIKDNEMIKKDVFFVLDTSGSMLDDKKIDDAKKSLKNCVQMLGTDDRFNLITFSSETRTFKDKLQEVTKSNISDAVKWIDEIEARGGTNIDEAIKTAIGMVDSGSKRPSIVVFISDGMATLGEQNHDKIIKNVTDKNTANIRIFTIGVGFDVNTHFLDKLSEGNKGTREYITPGENIEVKISNFYDKIAYPILSDVKVEVSGIEIYDRYPKNLQDMFRGSQMVVFGRYKGDGNRLITLSGNINGAPRKFEYEATFAANAESADFIPRIWATTKIGYLLDEIRLRGETKEVKEEVIKLAKEYGILTPYTSWLVLEDVKAQAGMGGDPRGRIPTPQGPGVVNDMEAARDSMSLSTGGGAVQSSRSAEKLKKGDYSLGEGGGGSEGKYARSIRETMKQIGDKTFYLNNGVWYDSNFSADKKDKIVKIKYLSDEYFDLIKKEPQLAKYMALGEKTVICFGEKIYEITESDAK